MKICNQKLLVPGRAFQLIVLLTILFTWSCNLPNAGQGNNVFKLQDSLSDKIIEPAYSKEDCNIIVGDPVRYKGLEIFPISLKHNVTGMRET